MKKSLPLLALVAVLLLGGAAAFLLLGEDSDRERSSSTPTAVSPSTVARPGQAPAADLAAVEEEVKEEEAAPARTALETEAEREERKMEERAARRAEGPFLTGRIHDAMGFPVQDAEVEVTRVGGSSGLFPIGGTKSLKTTTDKNGEFKVERKKRWDEVEVEVLADGYLPFRKSREFEREEGDEDLGGFELEAGVILAGQVVNAAGKPVAGAMIVRTDDEDTPFGFGPFFGGNDDGIETDSEGRFRLANEDTGKYVLHVSHEDYPDGKFPGETPPPGGTAELLLTLGPTAVIEGRIAGFPTAREHVRVGARLLERDPDDDKGGFREMLEEAGLGEGALAAEVEENGRFVIRGLQPGRSYAVEASVSEGFFGRRPCTDKKTVLAGTEGVELTWDRGATVTFRVVDASTAGKVDDVTVRFRWQEGQSGFMPDMTKKREFSTGRVELTELRPDGERTEIGLLITAPGYREHRIEDVAIPESGTVDLATVRLDPSAIVRLRVVDAGSGKPIKKARVRLSPEAEDQEDDEMAQLFGLAHQASSGRTDDEGWVELAACTTDTATITVTARNYSRYEQEGYGLPLQGTVEETVRMLEGGTVEITVIDGRGDPVSKTQVHHRGPGVEDGWATKRTNNRGEARIRNLIAGEHSFRPGSRQDVAGLVIEFNAGEEDDDEVGWETVTVADGQTTTLVLTVNTRTTVRGVVTSAGTPVERANVSLLPRKKTEGEEAMLQLEQEFGSFGRGATTSDKTDRRGRFELEEVATGPYRLRVSHSSRAMPHIVEVDVRDGTNVFDVDLPINGIEGRVVDHEGNPVADATVRAVPRSTSEESEEAAAWAALFGRSRSRGTKTGPDGTYRLEGVPEKLPVVVEAEASGFVTGRSDEVELTEGEVERNVTVELEIGGSIRVQCAGEVGPFTFVSAAYEGEEEIGTKRKMQRVGGDGEAVIADLAPGVWRVKIEDDEDEAGGELVEVKAGAEAFVSLTP